MDDASSFQFLEEQIKAIEDRDSRFRVNLEGKLLEQGTNLEEFQKRQEKKNEEFERTQRDMAETQCQIFGLLKHRDMQVPTDLPCSSVCDEMQQTISVMGLPEDVKERELENLLRWLPGYKASQINFKGEKPMGLALFSSSQFAIAAKDALQDMVFDAALNLVLHVEMTKRNLIVERGIVSDANASDQSKQLQTGGDFTHGVCATQPADHLPPALVGGSHRFIPPAPPPSYTGYPIPQVPMPTPTPIPAPSSCVPVQNTKDIPPCNTLFIRDSKGNANKDELRGLFSTQPGYKQMKILRRKRQIIGFIEFEDVNSATNVHQALQGSFGIRIQFSRRPRRKWNDSNYPAADLNANETPPTMTYQNQEGDVP